jgi:hypothetical protein
MTTAHRQLPPTPQEAALARMSGQRLSQFRGRTRPLQFASLMPNRSSRSNYPRVLSRS